MSSQEELLQTLDHTHRQMMSLIEDLSPEQLDVPYVRGINPPIWEVGHSAFFYEYFLLRPLAKVETIMPGFDPVWDSFDIPHAERWENGVVPSKDETLAYYNEVIQRSME